MPNCRSVIANLLVFSTLHVAKRKLSINFQRIKLQTSVNRTSYIAAVCMCLEANKMGHEMKIDFDFILHHPIRSGGYKYLLQ